MNFHTDVYHLINAKLLKLFHIILQNCYSILFTRGYVLTFASFRYAISVHHLL